MKSPMDFAISLAPPKCPDKSDIENLPSSSITTMAGSFALDSIYGWHILTAMPVAEINMNPSYLLHDDSKNSFMPPGVSELGNAPSHNYHHLSLEVFP